MDDIDVKILQALAAHDLNVTDTAYAVQMHRNSVLYRLGVIKRRTGLDPRKFYDLIKLLERSQA